jgi:hypothetical protein
MQACHIAAARLPVATLGPQPYPTARGPQGAALGPLVALALAASPAALLSAALGTAAVFGSFSLASLLSPRRSYLYLGGLLSSAVLALSALRLGAWLLGGQRLWFNAELYGGLLVFSGYVVFDTQVRRSPPGSQRGGALPLVPDPTHSPTAHSPLCV